MPSAAMRRWATLCFRVWGPGGWLLLQDLPSIYQKSARIVGTLNFPSALGYLNGLLGERMATSRVFEGSLNATHYRRPFRRLLLLG